MRSRLLVVLSVAAAVAACGGRANIRGATEERPGEIARLMARNLIGDGATACRYNLEDMFIHAISGVAAAAGHRHFPEGDIERRPIAASYAVSHSDGTTSHLQVNVGKDASGFCSLQWNETRVWERSCERKRSEYMMADDRLTAEKVGINTVLTGERSTSVLLTPLSKRRCLVTELDVAWRIDPDEAAREWIKDDHGYDPGENP